MIAADTNLLVRAVVVDDAVQAGKVRRLLEESMAAGEEVFVSHIALCELCWVLEKTYQFNRADVARAMAGLLADDCYVFQDRAAVEMALADCQNIPAQFADHLFCRKTGARGTDRRGCRCTWPTGARCPGRWATCSGS